MEDGTGRASSGSPAAARRPPPCAAGPASAAARHPPPCAPPRMPGHLATAGLLPPPLAARDLEHVPECSAGGTAAEGASATGFAEVTVVDLVDSELESFYQVCLREPPSASPEPWAGNIDISFREVLGVPDMPSARVVPALPPFGLQVADWALQQAALLLSVTLARPVELAPPGVGVPVAAAAGVVAGTLAGSAPRAPSGPAAGADAAGSGRPRAESGRRSRGRRRRNALALLKACSQPSTLRDDLSGACPICLEHWCRGQELRTLPCSHVLHSGCAARLFAARGVALRCPICRQVLERSREHGR